MAVDGKYSAWFHGIEHTLRIVILHVAEVVVHTKARRGLGFFAEFIK